MVGMVGYLGGYLMFLKVYESRKCSFPEGDVWVTRFPDDLYAVTGDNDEGVYKGFGDTPLAAIADYHAVVESEG
jgi:hypothetical protein